jgi:hypothetical protein
MSNRVDQRGKKKGSGRDGNDSEKERRTGNMLGRREEVIDSYEEWLARQTPRDVEARSGFIATKSIEEPGA